MTDRERLVELFLEIENKCKPRLGTCDTCEYKDSGNFCVEYKIIDHLIANGVIVPPCKVGDMVYRIAIDGKTITEERVGEIHLEFTIDDGTGWHNVWWLKEYNIGITTFLTREEAEKKLKELGK